MKPIAFILDVYDGEPKAFHTKSKLRQYMLNEKEIDEDNRVITLFHEADGSLALDFTPADWWYND